MMHNRLITLTRSCNRTKAQLVKNAVAQKCPSNRVHYKGFHTSLQKLQKRENNVEEEDEDDYDDKFETAFDMTEDEMKELSKGIPEEQETAFDFSRHYEVEEVLPFVAKNVSFERTESLLKLLRTKTTSERMYEAVDEDATRESDEGKQDSMFWRMYNRESVRPEQSDFQQQLEHFPHSVYGDNLEAKANLKHLEVSVNLLSDKQLGLDQKPRDHVFRTLQDVEAQKKKEQDREDNSNFTFLLSGSQDEKVVEPWEQQEYNAQIQSKTVSKVFKMIQSKLDSEKRQEAKALYDEAVQEQLKEGSKADYEIDIVKQNVVGEAARISKLNDAKYGQVFTKSSKNVDTLRATANPVSLPGDVLKKLNLAEINQLETEFENDLKMHKVFAQSKDGVNITGISEYNAAEDNLVDAEKDSATQAADAVLNNPLSFAHKDTRYFLNDEHFNRKFEDELKKELQTKSLEQVYRSRPYLLLDPIAQTIKEMADLDPQKVAAPFDPIHINVIYEDALEGKPLADVQEFFASFREAGNRDDLVNRLQLLLPTFARSRIELVLDRIVKGVVEPNRQEPLLEAKTYSGTKRSVIALSDLLNANSQPGIMTLSDLIARPRPKIEAVMYSVDQIAKGNVDANTLQWVAELGKTMNEKDYPTEWDYLYEVLKPIHEFQKEEASAEHDRKRFHPRIYSGLVRASGKRKDSVAHVTMTPGSGIFSINGRNYLDYFKTRTDFLKLGLPLKITQSFQQFDIYVKTNGGGTSGQRDAIKLALSKALGKFVPEFGYALSAHSMMTVDPRHVERKKFGLIKARKRPTFVKR